MKFRDFVFFAAYGKFYGCILGCIPNSSAHNELVEKPRIRIEIRMTMLCKFN